MSAISWILRIFSYLYHLAVALFLLALSLVALLSGGQTLTVDLLPWQGSQLTYWLLSIGLFGILSTALAIAGKIRFLFLINAIGLFGLLIRGVYLSPFRFDGPLLSWGAANKLAIAGLIAVIGAFLQMRVRSKTRG